MKLNEAIDETIEAAPTASPTQLAEMVLRMVTKDDLAPLLVDHLAGMQRHRTRETEREAFRTLMDREYPEPINMPDIPAGTASMTLSRLAEERFVLGDGTVVDWLQATIDDHLARISYLRAIQARYNQGVNATVDRHQTAIDAITAAGVTCLDELGDHVTP
jgi:outer membrane protein TolC